MMAFQFYLPSRKQKSKVGGDDSHIAFGKQFRGVKGSLRLCVFVLEHSVLLSPKFGARSVHIFTQSVWNLTLVCGTDCLACQDEFFVNKPLHIK
jgi:hypothetical protein